MSEKETNPKDGVGVRKWRQYATVPCTFVWGVGVAMLEGARKYGRHNYRKAGVRASVYVDAAKGHIDQFFEGEDIDAESGLHHLLKAAASIAVLYDGIVAGNWTDDRPPKVDLDKFRAEMQSAVDHIFEAIPEAKAPFTERGSTAGDLCGVCGGMGGMGGILDPDYDPDLGYRTKCWACNGTGLSGGAK